MDALAEDGVTYSNFHVTPLCSPTRASLLTGRNHHSVGMSMLSDVDSGYPGKRGAVSPRAAMFSEVMRDSGYSTAAFGKWHLAPVDDASSAGPFDQWPLNRGFEKYYGFLQGQTDQFFPDLVRDNHKVSIPAAPEDGYILTEDLVDNAIEFVSDHHSVVPDKPFLLYLALGTAHCPHQAPQSYLDRVRGRYDAGWDLIRSERLARQKHIGIVPEGTQLAPRNDGVAAWDELSDDERRLMARLQEAFAAMLEHTDDQLARLIAQLEELGIRDDTMILLLSDNGASQEGGPTGTTNTVAFENGEPVSIASSLQLIDDIGTWRCHTNYPWGWAQAGNTPLKRYKQNTHAGGVRAPLIISWRAGIPAELRGSHSPAFHHVIDIAPTILEAAGATMPEIYRGIPQLPVHGTPMNSTFNVLNAPSEHLTQYFEMYGHRALYHDGWKAVAFHQRGDDFSQDRWELYDLTSDFSECVDLAEARPELLHELIGRWWSEADRFGVFPLDDRDYAERASMYPRPGSSRRRRRFRFYPGMQRIPAGVAPMIIDRSFTITAEVGCLPGDRGVLVAQGDVNGGYALWLSEEGLEFEYNDLGQRHRVSGPFALTQGEHVFALQVEKTGERRDRATLTADGETVGIGEVGRTARYLISWQGLSIGEDQLSPVSPAYPRGSRFTGTLRHVEYALAHDD